MFINTINSFNWKVILRHIGNSQKRSAHSLETPKVEVSEKRKGKEGVNNAFERLGRQSNTAKTYFERV